MNPTLKQRAQRRSRIWPVGIGIVLLLVAGIAVKVLWPGPGPVPPMISTEEFDRDVARLLNNARSRVLKDPRSELEWGNYGHLLQAHGLEEQASQCYEQAHELDPQNPVWTYLVAAGLLSRDSNRALELMQVALNSAEPDAPYRTAIQLRIAETLLEMNRIAQASELIAVIPATDEQGPRLHYLRSLLAIAQGDWSEALKSLQQCVVHPQCQQKAAVQLARVHTRLGETEAAGECARRATSLPKDQPWHDPILNLYLSRKGGIQARYSEVADAETRGDLPQAIFLLRKQLALAPDPRTQLNLAILLSKAGEFAEAEVLLQQALTREQKSVQAHYAMAVVLYYQTEELRQRNSESPQLPPRYEQARRHVSDVLELKPDHALAHLYAGLLARRLGDIKDELNHMREACGLRPESPEVQLELGLTLQAAGETAAAREHLERAARLAPSHDRRAAEALERLTAPHEVPEPRP